MEDLTPAARFLFFLNIQIFQGKGLPDAIPASLEHSDDSFEIEMKKWWFQRQNKLSTQITFSTDYRLIITDILEKGLEGSAISKNLQEIYNSISLEQERQMNQFLERLPFKLMVPLLFFIFPGFLTLLLGPLVVNILAESSVL